MASIWRLARALQSCRTIAPAKTLNPRPYLSTSPLPSLCNRTFEQQNTNGSEGPRPNGVHELSVHTVLAGLLGFGLLDVSLADGVEAASKSPPLPESAKIPPLSESAESPPLPESAKIPPLSESAESAPLPESAKIPPFSEPAESPPVPESGRSPPPPKSPPSSYQELEELAKTEKARLEELIRSRGGTQYSYPRFTVAVKGQKVTIKFLVPPTCELPILITNLVSRLGVKAGDSADGSDMIVRAWDSGVAWQLTLTRPTPRTKANEDQAQDEEKNANDGDLCILMFRPLISTDKTEIEFMKSGSFSLEELDALASIMYLSGQPRILQPRPKENASKVPTFEKTVSSLEAMGVKVYGLKQPNIENPKVDISWDNIAGYDNQKREIEDTILLALKSPEVYDDIARGTRCKFEPNRPRAVLFEGPPGTGKTSCARVIANQGGVPLLYVPLEIIMSKYYGESERLLGKVFSLAEEIPSGAIIFLDEVDSIATARDSETHEATRRLLSVLLRQIDGFEQDKKVVVIAATNRKQDLDPALHSRFDSMIMFDLPDHRTREAIIAQYAKHLTKSELAELATATEEMSGRDIRDVCQQAERHWASKIIRGQAPKNEEQISLPPLQEYTESAFKRRSTIFSSRNQMQDPKCLSKKPQFDFL